MAVAVAVVLFSIAGVLALANWLIVFTWVIRRRSLSMLLLVGGIASTLGLLLLSPAAPKWLFLALPLLDPGVSSFAVLGPIELVRSR